MPRLPRANADGLLEPTPEVITIDGVPKTIFELPTNPFAPSSTPITSTPSTSSISPNTSSGSGTLDTSSASNPTTAIGAGQGSDRPPPPHNARALLIALPTTILATVFLSTCFICFRIWRRRRKVAKEKPVAPFSAPGPGPSSGPDGILETKRHIVALLPSDDFSSVLHVKSPPTPSLSHSSSGYSTPPLSTPPPVPSIPSLPPVPPPPALTSLTSPTSPTSASLSTIRFSQRPSSARLASPTATSPTSPNPAGTTGTRRPPVSWSTELLDSAVRQQLEVLNARVQQLEARERVESLSEGDESAAPPRYDQGLER